MPKSTFPRGSEWRKWDLHVHAPGTKLNDAYKAQGGADRLDEFCERLESSDVEAFGITDYFSADSFQPFLERYRKKYPNSKKAFFFNLELRLNEAVNKELEEVNVHLVFNPKALDKLDKFLERLDVVKTGQDGVRITCSELSTQKDFDSATVSREAIQKAFVETFGADADRRDHFLFVTPANNDGLRPPSGKQRKENICDEIDKSSDAFFGGVGNVAHYLKTDRYEDKSPSAKKPVIGGSDSHSFEDLEKRLGKRFLKEEEAKDGSKKTVAVSDVTWIKSDLTYDGLRQVIYEPESGERVFIGPVKPDEKEDYKVIRRIRFNNSEDFPAEIEFNDNLCSIIGSRSSGKSALLAYLAHSVDPAMTEALRPEGPGEGEAYRWSKVKKDYSIEWATGKTATESPGSIVYVPQNYLHEKSKDPNEVKSRIEPVLFKLLPEFQSQYKQALLIIDGHNNEIADSIVDWFSASNEIKALDGQLKDVGDKKAIGQQQVETEKQLTALRERYQLSAEELAKYQTIRAEAAAISVRNKEIDKDLDLISNASPTTPFFTSARMSFTPAVTALPTKLQGAAQELIEQAQSSTLKGMNDQVLAYKGELETEKTRNQTAIREIGDKNRDLIEKHKKTAELEPLVKASGVHAEQLKNIAALEATKAGVQERRRVLEVRVSQAISARSAILESLHASMNAADQSSLKELQFGLEYGLSRGQIEEVEQGLNMREITEFVVKNEVKIDEVRKNPAKFLEDLFVGRQKTKDRQEKDVVASRALQLTEQILFTAEMEGDKIGGFSAPTMTPGKRALFALRLILAESEDTWPLLIDQPEDDLDSRSIYDEVVPFLKAKKKERQIIMVSHNANLVIGADSEQLVVANRHGDDRQNLSGKQFNYLSGSLEFSHAHDAACKDTLEAQGVCEHACAILDGGKTAFESRKNKYQIR